MIAQLLAAMLSPPAEPQPVEFTLTEGRLRIEWQGGGVELDEAETDELAKLIAGR